MGKRSRQSEQKWRAELRRQSLALLMLLALHGLLAGVIYMKMARRKPQAAPVVEDTSLRLWSMSSADGKLVPLARDFLQHCEVVSEDEKQPEWLSVERSPDGVKGLEREREEAGLRLSWPLFTAALDGNLPQWPLTLTATVPMRLPSDEWSRSHEALCFSLWRPLELGREQYHENWRMGERVPGEPPVVERVLVSKYEDSAWESVLADDLAAEAAPFMAKIEEHAQANGSGDKMELGACEVRLSVIWEERFGARVHLRSGCGVKELDRLALAWALRRHAWKGHHHTDAPTPAESHSIDYVVEYRPGQ